MGITTDSRVTGLTTEQILELGPKNLYDLIPTPYVKGAPAWRGKLYVGETPRDEDNIALLHPHVLDLEWWGQESAEGTAFSTVYTHPEFDLRVDLYGYGAASPPPVRTLTYPMTDGSEIPTHLPLLTLLVREALRAGDRVVVNCQAGINRSAFVAAETLKRVGVPGADALAMIRDSRSAVCLSNPTFLTHVLSR